MEISKASITTPDRTDNSFAPKLTLIHNSKLAIKFEENCLKQDKGPFTHENVETILLFMNQIYTLSSNLNSNFTLKSYLFEAAMLATNANRDKYSYS